MKATPFCWFQQKKKGKNPIFIDKYEVQYIYIYICVHTHTYVEFFSDRDQRQTLRGSKQHWRVWSSEQLDSSGEARATQKQQEQGS